MKNALLLFCMVLFLATQRAPAAGEVFDGTVNDYDGVSMAVVDGTTGPDAVTVAVLNVTDQEILSGNANEFGLQVEQDGQWYWLEAKQDSYANTSEALVYQRDDPRELTFTWTHRYGTLAPGHYRVTKSFFVLEEPGARQEFLLACEFTLE